MDAVGKFYAVHTSTGPRSRERGGRVQRVWNGLFWHTSTGPRSRERGGKRETSPSIPFNWHFNGAALT